MVTDAMRRGEDGMSIRGEDGGRSEMQERKKKEKKENQEKRGAVEATAIIISSENKPIVPAFGL
jgi:hypothetical protein